MACSAQLSSLASVLAETNPDGAALMYRDAFVNFWHTVSRRYVSCMAMRSAAALKAAGVKRGESIMIYSDNVPECIYVSLGAYAEGIAVSPVYGETGLASLGAMARTVRARVVFAGRQEQYNLAASMYAACDSVLRVVTFDNDVEFYKGDCMSRHFDDFVEGFAPAEPAGEPAPDDVADVIFTSGTTGQPKGIPITYGMYDAALKANSRRVKVQKGWRVLEYLPYCHVFERTWAFFCLIGGAVLVINRQPSHVQRAMREIKPDAMCCVPHFWEKVYGVSNNYVEHCPQREREQIVHAVKVGYKRNVEYALLRKEVPRDLEEEYVRCDKSQLSVFRQRIGLERAKLLPTGGAVVAPQVERFVRACGLPLLVGYGLTETTATVSCDDFSKLCSTGSVGRVIDGLELKFGNNGEILLRGATVTSSYLTERGAVPALKDGWLHTGDAGRLSESGELYITGRIKHLLKTSNGKYVAADWLESIIDSDPYIARSFVIAEGRKYVAALIMPDRRKLEGIAAAKGLRAATFADLCAMPEVTAFIGKRLESMQSSVSPFSRVKRFVLLPEGFTSENGCLSAVGKLRRDVVARLYAKKIDAIYNDK